MRLAAARLHRGAVADHRPAAARPTPAFVAGHRRSASRSCPQLGQSLFPAFKERDFLIHWVTAAGHVGRRDGSGRPPRSARSCAPSPGVRSFGAHIGQALLGEEVAGVNLGENWISLDASADYDETLDRDRRASPTSYPGLFREVADLPRRADRGGPHRRQGAHRRPRLRRGPDVAARRRPTRSTRSWPASTGVVDAPRRHLHATCRRSRSRSTWPRRRSTASSRATSAGPRRRWSPARRSATSSGPARPTTSWSGAPRQTRHSVADHREPADRHAVRAAASGSATSPTVALQPEPQRHRAARATRGASTSARTSRAATSARWSTSSGRSWPRSQFARGYHAELLGEYQERQAAQSRLLESRRSSPALLILLLLQASFGSWRLAAAGLPHAADGAGRRRAGRLDRRRDHLARARWSASSPCSGSPPATASC